MLRRTVRIKSWIPASLEDPSNCQTKQQNTITSPKKITARSREKRDAKAHFELFPRECTQYRNRTQYDAKPMSREGIVKPFSRRRE